MKNIKEEYTEENYNKALLLKEQHKNYNKERFKKHYE